MLGVEDSNPRCYRGNKSNLNRVVVACASNLGTTWIFFALAGGRRLRGRDEFGI